MRILVLCILSISCLTGRADSLANVQAEATEGDPAAQLELAGKYLFGEGVAKDPQIALKWSLKPAEYAEKNPSWNLTSVAFATLATAYEDSEGAKHIQQAIKWYYKSAMLNDPRGMTGLSRIYSIGEGVPKDIVSALAWMYVAAGSGAPGTVDNSAIRLRISDLEDKAGADGVVLARKKCSELVAKIRTRPETQTAGPGI